jgi:hypothetical protein
MADKLTAAIKGKQLIITIDLNDPPTPSGSGKTTVLASSRGNQPTSLTHDGKPVIVGVNAYVK